MHETTQLGPALLRELRALRAEQRAGTAELRRLNASIETLVAQLMHSRSGMHASGPRDDDDRAVLLALVEVVAGTRFTAKEVVAHARLAPPLAAALARADCENARSLGRLLQRCAALDIAGLRLECVGRETDGLVYRVSRVE